MSYQHDRIYMPALESVYVTDCRVPPIGKMKFAVVILCLVGWAAASVIPRDLDDAHLSTVNFLKNFTWKLKVLNFRF